MVSKPCDPASKIKGAQGCDAFGNLTYKIQQLKKQIQADRVITIKDKLDKNRNILKQYVSQLASIASEAHVLPLKQIGSIEMLSIRMKGPLCIFSGFSQGSSGDRDYVNNLEIVSSTSTKLPYVEKIPPYTTWIFLSRNQRMAEDQSVVGRRRIYYDQHGSEALVCSDSEEETAEPEEEKHEFCEGEDRIIWMAFQEHGLNDEVMTIVSQFIGGTTSEIQERYNVLKMKHKEKENQTKKASGEIVFERSRFLEKSLSAALDSFDNLFCRRCLVFDCRLHGCSQSIINPSDKQCYSSENDDDRKPCSDQCYRHFRVDLPKSLPGSSLNRVVENSSLEEKDRAQAYSGDPISGDCLKATPNKTCTAEKDKHATSEFVSNLEVIAGALNYDTADRALSRHEGMEKRKLLEPETTMLRDPTTDSDDFEGHSYKKQKKLSAINIDIMASKIISVQGIRVPDSHEPVMASKNSLNESNECTSEKSLFTSSVTFKEGTGNNGGEGKDARKVTETKRALSVIGKNVESNCRWKPLEKELYSKGLEIFGKNSCLIARNLLSGLKTCKEVFRYMYDDRAATTHRSVVLPSSLLEDSAKAETDHMESEMPARSRLLRRRGRTRKLKYSWKSAGHPSILKRIESGKNLSCKQYTPCGCQFQCGKQCSCLHNGTCCEKYCGCSKSCKNRFRGCHCAKSQCRSRQCPCFAAGRECDPDVCRNCWVSCGDGSLGEPPRRGDGQCGNMRLLLRQQQRILLAKSDVAGWGAFIKNSVNKNEYLGEYTGELISHREADKRGKIYDRANSSFLFDLNDQYVLDAYRKGDKLKFANHSSSPNCYAKVMLVAGDHRVGIFSKEHIEASEELFYDYRYGPDQAPAWARKPEGSKRDDSSTSQGRAKKHQSH